MISVEDVIAAHPQAEAHGAATIAHWVEVANAALPDDRLKDPRTRNVSRIDFVMHHLTRGPRNLNAPHVRARVQMPGRRAAGVKATHPWAGTPHGERLMKAVAY